MNSMSLVQLVRPFLYVAPVIALLASKAPYYINNWRNGEYGNFGVAKEILKKDPACISGFAHCIEAFNKYPKGPEDNEENMCLYITVYLKCMFVHCDVKSARRRHAIIDATKGNLTLQDIECDFHFNNNKAKCLFKSEECESKLTARIENKISKQLCVDLVQYLRCRYEDCPAPAEKQLETISSADGRLLDHGVNCEIPHKSLVTRVKCSEPDMFKCDNGECILRDQTCDNVNDCTDNSDEISCDSKTSQEVQFFSRKQQRKDGIL